MGLWLWSLRVVRRWSSLSEMATWAMRLVDSGISVKLDKETYFVVSSDDFMFSLVVAIIAVTGDGRRRESVPKCRVSGRGPITGRAHHGNGEQNYRPKREEMMPTLIYWLGETLVRRSECELQAATGVVSLRHELQLCLRAAYATQTIHAAYLVKQNCTCEPQLHRTLSSMGPLYLYYCSFYAM